MKAIFLKIDMKGLGSSLGSMVAFIVGIGLGASGTAREKK